MQSSTAAIRLSRPNEGERLFRIWEASVKATHNFLSSEDRLSIGKQVREYTAKGGFWVAADEKDMPCGWMGMTGNKIDSLFIDPVFFRQGLGRRLIDHAFSRHETLLVDVNEANLQARNFYGSLGFRVTGRSLQDGDGRPFPILHLAASRSAGE